MKILVTGANGFVGAPLSRHLMTAGHQVVGSVRSHNSLSLVNSEINLKAIGNIDEITDWQNFLGGVDCIVHLANRVHVLNEHTRNPLALYKKVNTEGTIN